MAADWIKMRHNLETDPDVLRIAEAVGIDRFSVVGRLHMIWSWADQHSVDGCAIGATDVFLDELVCCAGFCKSLRKVGWLSGRDWDLVFPGFARHNGETAKKRAQAQKTMSRKRAASATNVAQTAQPEKRREEKNKHTHTPSELTEGFAKEWRMWQEYRFAKTGRAIDPTQADATLMELNRRPGEKAAKDILFSIRKDANSILDSDNDYQSNRRKTDATAKRGVTL